MAKASSRKKSSQKSTSATKAAASGRVSSAWVWSHYRGELDQSKEEKIALSNLQGEIQDNRQKAEPKSRGPNKNPTPDRSIGRNVKDLAKKDWEGRKAKGRVGDKKQYLIAGAIGLFLVAVIYKEKTENYAVNEPAGRSLPPAVFDEKKSTAASAFVKMDAKPIELLQVAAQKISEARDLGNEPQLDEALKSLKRLRDRQIEIDNALKALSEAYKTNKSIELKSAINQLEQFTK